MGSDNRSSDVDVSQLCRICAVQNEQLFPIFEGDGLEHKFEIKIKKYFSIQVSKDDVFPRQVCYECANTMLAWHALYLVSREADERLHSMLGVEYNVSNLDGKSNQESVVSTCKDTSLITDKSSSKLDEQQTSKASETVLVVCNADSADERAKGKLSLNSKTQLSASTRKVIVKRRPASAISDNLSVNSRAKLSASTSNVIVKTRSASAKSRNLALSSKAQLSAIARNIIVKTRSASANTGNHSLNSKAEPSAATRKIILKRRSEEPSSLAVIVKKPNTGLVKIAPKTPERLTAIKEKTKEKPEGPAYCLWDKGNPVCILQYPSAESKRPSDNVKVLPVVPVISSQSVSSKPPIASRRIPPEAIAEAIKSCFHCGKVISNKILLLKHERTHLEDTKTKFTFACKLCKISFESFEVMVVHRNGHEEKENQSRRSGVFRKAYICRSCGSTFSTEEKLSVHSQAQCDEVKRKVAAIAKSAPKPAISGKDLPKRIEDDLPKKNEDDNSGSFVKYSNNVKCNVCEKSFTSKLILDEHLKTHTTEEREKPFKCKSCEKRFQSRRNLFFHEITHSDVRSHKCGFCDKAFKLKGTLVQHMRIHLGPDSFPTHPCNVCDKSFRTRSRLKDHMRLHSGDTPFECKTCGKKFHRLRCLRIHEVCHVEKRPFICDVCGKGFKWSKNLRQHQSVHGDVRLGTKTPYQCDICGKQFAGKYSLKHHVDYVHYKLPNPTKKDQPSVCHLCGKILSTAQGLERHLKVTHTGVREFKCDLCEKMFTTKIGKENHVRSQHTGERPFACSNCPKAFTSLQSLYIHRTAHSENRPHKCTFCDKQFKRKSHLVLHIRTHTGEKPYNCDVCARGFSQKNDLVKHKLTHTSERPFECSSCHMTFRNKRDHSRHVLKHHVESQIVEVTDHSTEPCETESTESFQLLQL